jgi:TPR repeat protein
MNELAPTTEQTPAAQQAIDASDEQLMKALEENPDGLAAQLNEIAPGAQKELDMDQPVSTRETPDAQAHIAAAAPPVSAYNPLQTVSARAFAQDPQVSNLVAKEKGAGALNSRIQPDAALPAAFKDLESQAFKGMPEAQHDLAAVYTAGRAGVTQNFEKAALWFREAADQKIANAAYNLGVLYHQGLGVEKDLDRALYWYREAAKLGHPEAQYNLGIAYIEGIGTEYNAQTAAAFFESAANQGIVEAAYNLGLIYENGLIGGGAKPEDAFMWYKIASDGGSNDAKAALAQLSSALNIKPADVDKMVQKMQANYQQLHGRKAGPIAQKA